MKRCAAILAVALVGISGCASNRGRARPLDVTRLTDEPGWIVAAATPVVRQQEARDCGAASLATIDPAAGWRVRSWAELDAEWTPAGRPMLVVTGAAKANEKGTAP